MNDQIVDAELGQAYVSFVDALDDLLQFTAEDAVHACQSMPGGRGCYGPDTLTADCLFALVLAAARKAFQPNPPTRVVVDPRSVLLTGFSYVLVKADLPDKFPFPTSPTMTREELVAAAESIGMRFPFPVPAPREPCGLLTVSDLGGRYQP